MQLIKILLFLLGIAVIALLVLLLGLEDIRSSLSGLTLWQLLLLFCLQIATLLAGSWMWYRLLRKKGPISFSEVFLVNQASALLEKLTPSVKLGGEAAKVFLLRQRTGHAYSDLTGILVLQKFLSLAPFALLCLMVLLPALYLFNLPAALYAALPALLLILAVLGVLCSPGRQQGRDTEQAWKDHPGQEKVGKLAGRVPHIKAKIRLFLESSRRTASTLLTKKETAELLTLSLGIWIFYPLKVYLVCSFLGLDPGILMIAVSTLAAYLVSMLPLLPGGLGSYEGTMALVFTLADLDPAQGMAVALVSRSATFWFPMLLSAVSGLILAFSAAEGAAGKATATSEGSASGN